MNVYTTTYVGAGTQDTYFPDARGNILRRQVWIMNGMLSLYYGKKAIAFEKAFFNADHSAL